jgi:glycosyltransferase involved in cell wall biosynthesis
MQIAHKNKTPLKQKSLLIYADFGCASGFAKVVKELVDCWKNDKKLSIVIFAINDKSTAIYDYAPNVKVFPTGMMSPENTDIYKRMDFLSLLYKENFDTVFCLNDLEVFLNVAPEFKVIKAEKRKENRNSFKSIMYFPIDSEPRLKDVKVLDYFDEAVTYTEYAKSVLHSLVSLDKWRKLKVIPHGCNTTDFYPLDEEQKKLAKKEIFGSEDVFVFGTVNRNSVRKDLGSLVLGFAMFKQTTQSNAVLYLHCNPKDPMGLNLFRLFERLGLEIGKDVFLPNEFNENKGFEVSDLNKIYNSFDYFITTTTAEGFGLTVTEAMAVKIPVICPKHTSLTEITDNGNNTLNFMFSQQMVFINDYEKIRFATNPTEVRTLMEVAYNIKNEEQELQDMMKDKVENAYTKISSMKWVNIAKQFKVIIDKCCK